MFAQDDREANKHLRRSIKTLNSDLRILRKFDNSKYSEFVSTIGLFNAENRLGFMYDNLDHHLNTLEESLKYGDKKFRIKKRKVVKALTRRTRWKLFGIGLSWK